MHELDPKEAPFQAPPVPLCLHHQRFMPPVMSIYASQHIREIPREKAIAYARALQHFAKQNNPLKENEQCPLVESVIELRREIKFYLSFMDEEVFRGVDLPKKEESSPMVPTIADVTPVASIPGTIDVPEVQPIPSPMPVRKTPKYARWEKILHPSWLVLATGEIPEPATMWKSKGRIRQLTRTIPIILPLCLSKAPSPLASPPPARALELKWLPTLPQGFTRVMACLKTPEVVEVGWEMPMGSMSIGLVLTPGISSVSSSHVVQDDTMGLVYMDTVTTSIGRVILGRSGSNEGPIIEDITDQ